MGYRGNRMAASVWFCSPLSCQIGQGKSQVLCPLRTSRQQRHRSRHRCLHLKQAQSDIHLPGKESKLIALWLFNRMGYPEAHAMNRKKNPDKIASMPLSCSLFPASSAGILSSLQPTNLPPWADSSQNLRRHFAEVLWPYETQRENYFLLSLWM